MADFKSASDAISDLKVGSTAVSKVYMGGDLVWEPASSGTDDWDTYDDGIFRGEYHSSSSNTLTEITAVSSGSTPTSTNYYSSPTRVRLNGYANATARPAVAIWIPAQTTAASTNATGIWQYYTKATDQTAAGSARTDYEFVKNNSGGTGVLPTNRKENQGNRIDKLDFSPRTIRPPWAFSDGHKRLFHKKHSNHLSAAPYSCHYY